MQPRPSRIPARDSRLLLADGVCSRLMDTLTGGPFLAGLGLLVGASNFLLGLLAALPFLAQVAQLPTLAILLRVRDRRRVTVVASGMARLLLGVVALLLFVAPHRLDAALLVALLGIGALLTVVATAAWNWWMRDLLPHDELGRFFGHRLRFATGVAMGALLLAGWGLDRAARAGHEAEGYAWLFALGCLAGLIGNVMLQRTPHVEPPPSPPAARSMGQLRAALRRPETSRTLAALALVSAAVTFALPFVAVFLLRALGLSYALVAVLAVVSQVGYMAGLLGWGHLSDRHGDRGVLLIGMGLVTLCMAGWAATGWETSWTLLAWLAALHFGSGFGLGAADLGATNLMLKTSTPQQAPAHLAAIGLGRAALAGAGTVLAGLLWDLLGSGPLMTVGDWSLRGFQVLALLAALLSAGSMVALALLPASHRVPVREVALTMRREVQQMSSIAGIRAFLHAISYSVELFAAPFAARQRERPPGPTPPPEPGPQPPT